MYSLFCESWTIAPSVPLKQPIALWLVFFLMDEWIFPPETPSGIGRINAVCWGDAPQPPAAEALCGIDATPIASIQATNAATFVLSVMIFPAGSTSFPFLKLKSRLDHAQHQQDSHQEGDVLLTETHYMLAACLQRRRIGRRK